MTIWMLETARIRRLPDGHWRTLPIGGRWDRARKLRQAYGRKKGHR